MARSVAELSMYAKPLRNIFLNASQRDNAQRIVLPNLPWSETPTSAASSLVVGFACNAALPDPTFTSSKKVVSRKTSR